MTLTMKMMKMTPHPAAHTATHIEMLCQSLGDLQLVAHCLHRSLRMRCQLKIVTFFVCDHLPDLQALCLAIVYGTVAEHEKTFWPNTLPCIT